MKVTKAKYPVLLSYADIRGRLGVVEAIERDTECDILLDSGAVAAFYQDKVIDLDEYMDFLRQYSKHFWRYIALDKIMDPKTTRKNLAKMYAKGFNPIPVHVWGEDEDWMDELYQYSDLVAAVIRPNIKAHPRMIERGLELKTQWAKGRRLHILGLTQRKMLNIYKPYSCDSTTWQDGGMYGATHPYVSHGRWAPMFRLFGDNKCKRIHPDVLRVAESCGFTAAQFMDPQYWRGGEVVPQELTVPYLTTAVSWVRYIRDVKKALGTKIFLAANANRWHDLLALFRAVAPDATFSRKRYLRGMKGARETREIVTLRNKECRAAKKGVRRVKKSGGARVRGSGFKRVALLPGARGSGGESTRGKLRAKSRKRVR